MYSLAANRTELEHAASNLPELEQQSRRISDGDLQDYLDGLMTR